MSTKPMPSRPPPPVPKPGYVKVVRAVWPFEGQNADELTFDEGDTIYIFEQNESGWWKGKCGNKEGLVPANYVEDKTETIDYPLHEAAKRGNITFLVECIKNKVSVNGLDKAGSTPLHWASHGGHVDCIEQLLKKGCQVNVQNKLGDTPLHSAAWRGHAEAVKLLLAAGAKADIRNNDRKLPYDLSKDASCSALLQQAVRPRQMSTEYGDEEDSD